MNINLRGDAQASWCCWRDSWIALVFFHPPESIWRFHNSYPLIGQAVFRWRLQRRCGWPHNLSPHSGPHTKSARRRHWERDEVSPTPHTPRATSYVLAALFYHIYPSTLMEISIYKRRGAREKCLHDVWIQFCFLIPGHEFHSPRAQTTIAVW